MKNLMFLISLVLMFGMHTTAQSQIEIFGLSWGVQNIQREVERMGYRCIPGDDVYEKTCLNGQKEIEIHTDSGPTEKIVFSCEVFNGCNYTLREVQKAVIDSGVISDLDEYNTSTQALGLIKITAYCGRGSEGDRLCVEQASVPAMGEGYVEIILYKDRFGPGMSFN